MFSLIQPVILSAITIIKYIKRASDTYFNIFFLMGLDALAHGQECKREKQIASSSTEPGQRKHNSSLKGTARRETDSRR